MIVDIMGNNPELIVLEGEKYGISDTMNDEDYYMFMGADYFTPEDVNYLDTYYPEYMGMWGTIIAAAGKGIKKIGGGIFKGVRKAVKRKKRRKKQAAAKKRESANLQRKIVIQQAAAETYYRNVEVKKAKNKSILLIGIIGLSGFLYFKNRG